MRAREINKNEVRRIAEEYMLKRQDIEYLVKRTAEVLSSITNQTGICLFPKSKRHMFKHIDLVSINRNRLLVLLVTSTGLVKNFVIETNEDVRGDLSAIMNLLNGEFYGLSLNDIKERLLRQIKQEHDSTYLVLKRTSELIDSMLDVVNLDELYLEGTSCLLSQPEFENIAAAKNILKFFENKNKLLALMEQDMNEEGVKVYIGREIGMANMENCSLVTSGYKLKNELVGRLGIIGPTRMEYDHMISLVDYVSDIVSSRLSDFVE